MSRPALDELLALGGKVALVTGAAGGIGRAVADRLAEAGAKVMICDLQAQGAADAARAINDATGSERATSTAADLARVDDARRCVADTVARYGRLDIVVNNAGVFSFRPLLEIDEALWDHTLDVNLKGLFFTAQAGAKAMIDSGRGGTIVNIASIDAFRPTGHLAHYDASKGGVVMLTRALALELGPHGIRVHGVAPGGVMTPGVEGMQGPPPDRTTLNRLAPPIQAMAEPDEIARLVLFLASAGASNMTGGTIVCDGGTLLA